LQDTLYTRTFVVELVLEWRDTSIPKWMDRAMKSAKKANSKMVQALRIGEENIKVLISCIEIYIKVTLGLR